MEKRENGILTIVIVSLICCISHRVPNHHAQGNSRAEAIESMAFSFYSQTLLPSMLLF